MQKDHVLSNLITYSFALEDILDYFMNSKANGYWRQLQYEENLSY